jgi:hypothetical protein
MAALFATSVLAADPVAYEQAKAHRTQAVDARARANEAIADRNPALDRAADVRGRAQASN